MAASRTPRPGTGVRADMPPRERSSAKALQRSRTGAPSCFPCWLQHAQVACWEAPQAHYPDSIAGLGRALVGAKRDEMGNLKRILSDDDALSEQVQQELLLCERHLRSMDRQG